MHFVLFITFSRTFFVAHCFVNIMLLAWYNDDFIL